MNDKSYVTMEQHQCIVCGQLYDTGALLLDKHMKPVFNQHTTTGHGLCPEHQKLSDDGYIALVEVTNTQVSKHLNPSDAYRTGKIAHVRKTVANEIFNVPFGDSPMAYVKQGTSNKKGVIDILAEMQSHE